MAALREIFARFGVAFDSGPLARGEAQIQKVTSALGTFGLAVGGAAIVAGVRSFVNDIRDAGDELGDTSTRLGVTTDQLQAWRHAAELSGSSGEALTDALDKMQRTLGEAAGGSQEARDALRRLGIDAQNADGSVRGVGEVIPELAESLSRMASPAERTAALAKVMGRTAGELGPLFANGAEGVAALVAEYEQLGGGLSEDAIQAASDLADAQLRLDAALLGVKSSRSSSGSPTLSRGSCPTPGRWKPWRSRWGPWPPS
jgi:TP901 family phage tail tape measure protein